MLSSGYFSSDSMAALHLILFCNWKTQDSCAKKYFNIHISKITFARGKCSDIKSRNETGFLTRLSNCLSIDSWGTSSTQKMHRHTLGAGVCFCLLPWVCAHRGTCLFSRSTSHLSAMPHRHVSCHLCCAFPLHHQSSPSRIRPVQEGSPSFLPQDTLAAGWGIRCVDKGRSAPFPASVTSHQTGINTSADPFHTSPLEG